MEAPFGPPATLTCEPGQARKGAATMSDVCAGMWLEGASTHLPFGNTPPRTINSNHSTRFMYTYRTFLIYLHLLQNLLQS